MTDERQEVINEAAPVHSLTEIISPLRLGTYLNAAGHNAERALQLYLWNAKIGEAFHLPIQAVEVGLRNRVNDGLVHVFGAEWWQQQDFVDVAEGTRLDDVQLVLRRLDSKGKERSTGQVVAGLSFGFWVAMLHRRYNPEIWSHCLRSAFPKMPAGITRDVLHTDVREIAEFRNRIWHHEPIFRRNLSNDFSMCMKVVQWLCPEKAAWIRPHCRVQSMLREKP
ncbi:MAG: hypothetical protein AAGA06_05940 [Pseudomonadota bacterium]